MILAESLHVMLQRVQARRGDDAGLPHGAAQHLADPARARDRLRRSQHQRPYRRTQALRKANRNRVEVRADRPGCGDDFVMAWISRVGAKVSARSR